MGIFKPPELLLGVQRYDFQVDMWSFGVMLASMAFRKEPFFLGNSISDQLVEISRVLGTDGLYTYCRENPQEVDSDYADTVGQRSAQPLSSLVNPENQHLMSNELLNLLHDLLQWDPKV